MKSFTFTVKDPMGIHARPAGLLAKMAKTYPDTVITLTKGEKTVKMTQLMMLMGLLILLCWLPLASRFTHHQQPV